MSRLAVGELRPLPQRTADSFWPCSFDRVYNVKLQVFAEWYPVFVSERHHDGQDCDPPKVPHRAVMNLDEGLLPVVKYFPGPERAALTASLVSGIDPDMSSPSPHQQVDVALLVMVVKMVGARSHTG